MIQRFGEARTSLSALGPEDEGILSMRVQYAIVISLFCIGVFVFDSNTYF